MAGSSEASRHGRVVGVAVRPARFAPMMSVDHADAVAGAGLIGDHKGLKFPGRGVSLLAIEDWQRALSELDDAGSLLSWTSRRANLLLKGLRLPRARGAMIAIGEISLEVTAQTYPCARMNEAHPGLMKALAPDWRGGVTCRVISSGRVSVGDDVVIVSSIAAGIHSTIAGLTVA